MGDSMACDICGKNTSALEDLLEQYQTKEVKQICPDCLKLGNKALWKMRDVAGKLTTNWFKRYLLQARAVHQPEGLTTPKLMHPDHDDKNDHCNCPSCH